MAFNLLYLPWNWSKTNVCRGGMGFGMTIFQQKHTIILMLLAFSFCFIVCLCSLATAKHVQSQHAVADLEYPNSKGRGANLLFLTICFRKLYEIEKKWTGAHIPSATLDQPLAWSAFSSKLWSTVCGMCVCVWGGGAGGGVGKGDSCDLMIQLSLWTYYLKTDKWIHYKHLQMLKRENITGLKLFVTRTEVRVL